MAPEKNDGECASAAAATGGAVEGELPASSSTGQNGAANTSTVSVDSTNGDHDPYYEPVVSLPEVDIKTHEEEEDEVYKGRCKLFRYVHDNTEGGEWKERGTGNVKLLKHPERGTMRLLMRQEKTLKVRANHYVTPYMKLRPNCDSDRAFVWYVMYDFADEETKSEMFAIRFANADNARLFKEAFEEAVSYVTSVEVADSEDEDKENKEQDENRPDNKPSSPSSDTSPADPKADPSAVVEGLEKLKVSSEGASETAKSS